MDYRSTCLGNAALRDINPQAIPKLRTLLLYVGNVRLRGFAGVMGRMQGVGMRGVRVMRGRLMMSGGVVPSGFLVMLRRVFVMFGGLGMKGLRGVAVSRFLRHKSSPLFDYLGSDKLFCPLIFCFFVAERGMPDKALGFERSPHIVDCEGNEVQRLAPIWAQASFR